MRSCRFSSCTWSRASNTYSSRCCWTLHVLLLMTPASPTRPTRLRRTRLQHLLACRLTARGGRFLPEDGAGDVMPPSPFLATPTEQAVAGVARLSDNELVGVLRATQRQIAREQYKQVLAAAEFGRRRQAAFQAVLARGVPAGCAAGGFPVRNSPSSWPSPAPKPGT